MNQPDFEVFALALQEDAFKVLTGKGKDYARNNDAFHNFHTTAEFLGLKREEILASHLYKHFAAIFAFVREGQVETEPIRGRIIDAINYLTFLAAMADSPARGAGTPPQPVIQQLVDIAPGREIKWNDEYVRAETERLRKAIEQQRKHYKADTGPPWYLPGGGYKRPDTKLYTMTVKEQDGRLTYCEPQPWETTDTENPYKTKD